MRAKYRSRLPQLSERLFLTDGGIETTLIFHELQKSEVIIVLCSHDTIVAERGAELVLAGWAPLLVFTGGLGTITRHLWSDPEAERFARIAVAMGVPADRILIENRATNTGENVAFTRDLLTSRGLDPDTFILVQKPYMERRTFATFQKVWPGKSVRVTSPQLSMDEYFARYSHEALTVDDVISIMSAATPSASSCACR